MGYIIIIKYTPALCFKNARIVRVMWKQSNENNQNVIKVGEGKFWQFATFWWSAIILLKKGKIYLVEEMWWNHLDSTPTLIILLFLKQIEFYYKF